MWGYWQIMFTWLFSFFIFLCAQNKLANHSIEFLLQPSHASCKLWVLFFIWSRFLVIEFNFFCARFIVWCLWLRFIGRYEKSLSDLYPWVWNRNHQKVVYDDRISTNWNFYDFEYYFLVDFKLISVILLLTFKVNSKDN